MIGGKIIEFDGWNLIHHVTDPWARGGDEKRLKISRQLAHRAGGGELIGKWNHLNNPLIRIRQMSGGYPSSMKTNCCVWANRMGEIWWCGVYTFTSKFYHFHDDELMIIIHSYHHYIICMSAFQFRGSSMWVFICNCQREGFVLFSHIGLELVHRFDKIVRAQNLDFSPSWLVHSKNCDFEIF